MFIWVHGSVEECVKLPFVSKRKGPLTRPPVNSLFVCLVRLGGMGGGSSVPQTPLQCMLKNFKKGFSRDYGKELKPEVLKNLCQEVWPAMELGWPCEGSFDPGLILKVHQRVTDPNAGCKDQYAFIDQWQLNVLENPRWIQDCKAEQARIMIAKATAWGHLPKLNKMEEVGSLKPFYCTPEEEPSAPPPPYHPTPTRPRDEENLDEGSAEEGAVGYSPIYPDVTLDLTPIKGKPEKEQTIRKEKDIQEVLKDQSPYDPVSNRTRLKNTMVMAPLRATGQYVPDDGGGMVCRTTYQVIPFSTADLLNWKLHYGPFTEKPQDVIQLVSTIMATHNPTWADIQQLLNSLLNPEEREKLNQGITTVLRAGLQAGQTIEGIRPIRCPHTDPGWDPNTDGGRDNLQAFQRLIIDGLKEAGKRPVNMSKPSLVIQEPQEDPAKFYARLLEAYKIYTPIDPLAPENARMINLAFVSQSAPDIQKKLQKQEGFLGMNISQLMEIARKVYINRDKLEEKKRNDRMKTKAQLLAAAITGNPIDETNGGNRGRGRGGRRGNQRQMGQWPRNLDRNQCANCGKYGHWKNECDQPPRQSEQRGRGRGQPPRGGRGNYQATTEEVVGMANMEQWDD